MHLSNYRGLLSKDLSAECGSSSSRMSATASAAPAAQKQPTLEARSVEGELVSCWLQPGITRRAGEQVSERASDGVGRSDDLHVVVYPRDDDIRMRLTHPLERRVESCSKGVWAEGTSLGTAPLG